MNEFKLVVFAVSMGTFLYGMSVGIDFVVVPLMFEAAGLTKTEMGILFALELASPLFFAHLLTIIIPKFGIKKIYISSLCTRNITLALIPFFGSFYAWLPMQFVFGAGGFCLFLTLQLWINNICSKENRAMTLGALNAAFSFGIAIGPLLLSYIGTSGKLPFIVSSLLCTMMFVPISFVLKYVPTISSKSRVSILDVAKKFPVALGGGILVDYMFFSLSSFLVLYGMDNGLNEPEAAFLITSMLISTIILDIPIGWISDHMNRNLMITICAAIMLICSQILKFTINDSILVIVTFAIWCGAMGGIYTSSLAIVGENYHGDDLTAANSAFAFVNCIGSISGVCLSGIAIDYFGSEGLTISVGGISLLYLIINMYDIVRKYNRSSNA